MCREAGSTTPTAARPSASPTRSGLPPSRPWPLGCSAALWMPRSRQRGVTGDEVYGADPGLRAELEARGIGYVLAVACDHRVRIGGASHRADALLRRVPARAWQQVSCGKGAKGHRLYDWAFIRLDHHGPAPSGQAGQHWLMIRRNQRTGELAFYRCSTPRPVPLSTLVRVAGIRWTVEERFQTGKGLVGLDPPVPGPPLALLVPVGHPWPWS